MKIRVINENDWERTYELDKSIIRVGSQLSCDIQLAGKDIQPMQMQIVRSGGKEIKYTLRIFADNVQISRGEQIFTGQQMVPYDVLDGDKLIFGPYRMTLSLDDEQTRVRSSSNMEAKMYIQKRELAVDSPINGVLRLKNTGAEKACQFRLQIRGIPDECLTTAPLPYLYPGGKSTVGFMISHLQTKPAPGFHTVSISISAPDDYFGEVLEFRQDIYVNPVFKNEITLEDDSAELTGFNKAQGAETKQEEPEQQPAASYIQETARMIPGQAVIEKEDLNTDAGKEPVVISGADNKNAFDEEAEDDAENEPRRRRSNRKQKVNVIRHDDGAFTDDPEDEEEPEESVTPEEVSESPEKAEEQTPVEVPGSPEKTDAPSGPEEAPVRSKRSSGRKKKSAPGSDEKTDAPAEEPKKPAAKTGTKKEPEPTAAPERTEELEPAAPAEPERAEEPEPVTAAAPERAEEPEPAAVAEPEQAEGPGPAAPAEPEPAEEPEPATAAEPEPAEAEVQPEKTKEDIPDAEPVSGSADMPETDEKEPEAGPDDEQDGADEEVREPSAAEPLPQAAADLSEPEEAPEPDEESPEENNGGSGTEEKSPARKTGKAVVRGGGTAPIPVVRHNDSFDFAEEDEPSAPLPEKKPEVRFVKRGNFDE